MTDQKWHPILVRALIQCLQDIFEGQFYADKVLERAFKKNRKWGSRDRHFLASHVYDMVRWWSRLAAYDQGGFKPATLSGYFTRWAFYEAWKHQMDAVEFLRAGIPESSLTVKTYEEIVKAIESTQLSAWDSVALPQWLFEKIANQYGDEAPAILNALNQPAPVCLRANTLKTSATELRGLLESEGIVAKVSEKIPDALILEERKNVFTTESFKKGFFEVQDEGSQHIAILLDPKPLERIADVCAGAGGKTLHLSALMKNKGSLLAGDNYSRKLQELKTRAVRAGVSNLRIQLFENSKDLKRHHEKFDGVLVDAPCSGTGVLRRNPDTKWKLSVEELERLKDLQQKILGDYSKFVRPGGRLVYATCSLLREENEDQVTKFLDANPTFKTVEPPMIRRPHLHNEDGFFASVIRRSP